MSDKVITRLQKFLRVLVDESAYMPEPLKILEKACCYACGHLDTMPKPVTRTEKLIASVRDKSIVPPTPVTRLEKYIAAIAGYYTDDLPEPVTREDKILYDLACGEDVTLSGNPLVLENSIGKPLKECVISWEPTQAGSGEPYPAGGGPNLLDISKCTAGFTPYGLTTAISGELLTIKGTASTTSDSASFVVAMTPDTSLSGKGYKVTAFPAKGSITNAYGLRTADETAIAVLMPLTEGTAVDVALRIMVSKDTPTAYAPYENIRPISGRDAVQAERCGENLFDISKATPVTPAYAFGLTVSVDGDIISLSGTTYASAPSAKVGFRVLKSSQTFATQIKWRVFAISGAAVTFHAVNTNDNSIMISVALQPSTAIDAKFRLVAYIGDTPTAYTPYRGDTYTLALPETVCGGTVDAATGEGAETWKLVTLDGSNEIGRYRESEDTDTYKVFVVVNVVSGVDASRDAICSHFKRGMATSAGYHPNEFVAHHPAGHLYLRTEIPGVTSVETFKSYLAAQYAAGTPVQIAYKLAEPVAFEATGAAGEITTFKGTNTIMTDADEITATYKCNVQSAEITINNEYKQLLAEMEDLEHDSKTLQTSD